MRTRLIYFNPETSEVVEEGTPGAFAIEEAADQGEPDQDWLGDWLTRSLVKLDAEEAALKKQTAKILGEIKARRAYLSFAYNDRLKIVVRAQMKARGGAKKSVNFSFGTAGWRQSNKTIVKDSEAAIRWAEENCPEAIKRPDPTILTSQLPKKTEVPGVVRESKNEFFVRGSK